LLGVPPAWPNGRKLLNDFFPENVPRFFLGFCLMFLCLGPGFQLARGSNEQLKIEGTLKPNEGIAKDAHKVHNIKMKSGNVYQIDLVGKGFDVYLRLEDSAGRQIAQDGDNGGGRFPDARITFTANKDDTYRIVVSGFDEKSGAYTLTVGPPSKAAAVLDEVEKQLQQSFRKVEQDFKKAKATGEKDKSLDEYYENVARCVGGLLGVARDFPRTPDAGKAIRSAMKSLATLSNSSSDLTVNALRNLVETADDKSVRENVSVSLARVLRNRYERAYRMKDKSAKPYYAETEQYITEAAKRFPALSKEFDDDLFRLQHLSLGKIAPEIQGEDLDGIKFKLSDYRGKVVVISFWGNW
jgi:hypothetical protein